MTLKVVSESRVTWAICVLVFLAGLSVLELGPMYAKDRHTSDKSDVSAPWGGGIKTKKTGVGYFKIAIGYEILGGRQPRMFGRVWGLEPSVAVVCL